MTYKNPFRNKEFDDKINSVKNQVESYLNEKEIELTDLTIDELIQWHDVSIKGPRLVYPHEKCPKEIKNIVQKFINEEFNQAE